MRLGADSSDNTIVNVARLPHTMMGEPEPVFVAMTEVPVSVAFTIITSFEVVNACNRFDPITLATHGHLDLRGQGAKYQGTDLVGQTTSAHPHFDKNGTVSNLNLILRLITFDH